MAKDEFQIQMPKGGGGRQAYRTRVPGLDVWVDKHQINMSVSDLSAGGVGLMDNGRLLQEGENLVVDFLLNDQLILSRVTIRVMRLLNNGLAGCTFEDLDRRQEALLDKLVLEVQKRMISMRNIQVAQDE